MSMQITTVTSFVPVVGEGELQRRPCKFKERDNDLETYARHGWELAHTATITGPELVTYVFNLTRDGEWHRVVGAISDCCLPPPPHRSASREPGS